MKKEQIVYGLLRISLGWIFFWAFIDKVFGLGFATKVQDAWLNGGSPTLGFLKFATKGPFASFYQSIAGNTFVNWLFMLGLLFVGLSLLLGIGVRIGCYSGVLMLLLFYSAVIPPANNPFMDEHIVFSLVLIMLSFVKSGYYLGFGKQWSSTELVKRCSFLE